VLRNGTYPISVSSERIFQGMAIARYAKRIGADAIAHGSTGAGNDQVRFDMTFLVMCPNMEIITLTRDGNLSRKEEVDYLNAHGFNADFTKLKYSYNVGIWGTSICGGEILDSRQGLPESAYLKQVTKTGSETLAIEFKEGEICGINGKKYTDKIAAIQAIEEIGCAYGIGRDMHEDPYIPCYGTPGTGPILREGMTICVEPMIFERKNDVRVLKDGWTVVAKDGGLTSHYENTLVVTKDGCEILTKL
jgi:argininosuccinate synthase